VASEIEIRAAIVGQITTALALFTPPPLVLDRDITGFLESGSIEDLRDSDNLVHCITVTQRSMLPDDKYKSQAGTMYDLVYDVIQWKQYRSGTDASNSDKEASLERDALIHAFGSKSALPALLKRAGVEPIEWPNGLLNKPRPITGGQVWVSGAILKAQNFYGPVACS
jgi:hypothetical protein